MANKDIKQNNLGGTGVTVAGSADPGIAVTDYDDFQTIATMRTALAAAQPATYTAARLDCMTKNDMIFALRQVKGIAYK